MAEQKTIQENALEFVSLLTPGNFDKAKEWIAKECAYRYMDQDLKGDAIIQSFSENHQGAKEKFESIEYLDGFVNSTEGNTVFVGVRDKITAGSDVHIYEDCLAVTVNEKRGPGSIQGIKHCPIPEERDQLKAFMKKIGLSQ
ncbi:MAG: hypothetical protein AAF203_07540 [Pseudomonadota bacterium]